MRHIPTPLELRAGLWAARAAGSVRRQLRSRQFGEIVVPGPPRLPGRARPGVLGVLRRLRATCLVRSLVIQAWDAEHDRPRDLVIGVTSPKKGFRAHAWLDGDPVCHTAEFRELLRRPPGSSTV